MAGHKQNLKSRVVQVNSEESWDFYIAHARNQDCPIVVHFTAIWCMPSVAMNHFFEGLALNHQDILFLSVDVDEAKGVAAKMQVRAMPTFLLMKEGAQVDKIVGANPNEIKKRIHKFIDSIRAHNI